LFGSDGVVSKTIVKGYATALRLYDISGGWRIGQRYRRVTKQEALAHLPSLNTERLVAGFLYQDARGDDARVALTLARTAALDFNADVANYVRALSITHDSAGALHTLTCRDERSATTFTIATTAIVNATGVWADDIFAMAEHEPSHRVTPAKGVHVTVPRERLAANVAAVLNVPGDRRSIFVVPFEDAPYTFIGTTDTAYEGPLDRPECTPQDVAYLLDAVNASTSSHLTLEDITGLWAGLRPLLVPAKGKRISERTADLSRRHQVLDTNDGVVHVTGGKWTTYRQMAEDTVDALRPYVAHLARVRTKNLRLHGVGTWRPSTPLESHLFNRYGQDTTTVLALIEENPLLAHATIDGQSYVDAEFVFAARHEMVTSLVDLVTRRTRAHLHDARATLDRAAAIAALVAPDLDWDDVECQRQVDDYRELANREFTAAGLTL